MSVFEDLRPEPKVSKAQFKQREPALHTEILEAQRKLRDSDQTLRGPFHWREDPTLRAWIERHQFMSERSPLMPRQSRQKTHNQIMNTASEGNRLRHRMN